MKSVILTVAIASLAAMPALAKAPAAPPPDPAQEVIKAEQAFDAYTFQHGFTHGFYAFSAPDAVSFNPAPSKTHERMAEAIAKDPSEKDAPSSLRWWPAHVGVAKSGDLAYDLGCWTNGNDPQGGWFFTVWKKQPDGKWLWVIDTGAGKADIAALPPKERVAVDFRPAGTADTPKAASDEVSQSEAVLNKALSLQNPQTAFNGFLAANAIVTDGTAIPAQTDDAYPAALNARPSGLVWQMDYGSVSQAGDFAYTYGHASDAGKATKGYYIRVWRKDGPELADWHIVADIFHATK